MTHSDFVSFDWGGTSYKGLLLLNETKKLVSFAGPSKNIRQCSDNELDQYCQTFLTQIKQLSPHASLEIFGGVAGGGSQQTLKKMALFLEKDPNVVRVNLYPDCIANLHAAFPDGNGILSINGTGSILVYKSNGVARINGGHGYLIDKAPSGAAYGQAIISALLKFHDGNESFTDVFRLVTANDKNPCVKSRETLLEELYQTKSPQSFLASFSPFLTELALTGNKWANRQIELSLNHLIEQIALIKNSSLEAGQTMQGICLAGGLWDYYPPLKNKLLALICQNKIDLEIVSAPFSNLIGPILEGLKNQPEVNNIFKNFVALAKEEKQHDFQQ